MARRRLIAGLYRALFACVLPWGILAVSCATDTASFKGAPGEYEFPVESNGPLVSGMVTPSPLAVGAEVFESRSARELLRGPTDITFFDTGSDETRQFHGMFGGGTGPVSYDAAGVNWEGEQILSLMDGVVRCDPRSDELLDEIFDYTVRGIDAGEWRLDPNLEGAVDVSRREVSDICLLGVELEPGRKYRDTGKGSYNLQGTAIYLGVYYTYKGWPPGEDDVPIYEDENVKEYELETMPHVFIQGSLTTSHIYVLGQEWATRLHDTALLFEKRLKELESTLSHRNVTFEQDVVVAKLPPGNTDRFESLSWKLHETPDMRYHGRYRDHLAPPMWRTLDNGVREVFMPAGTYRVPSRASGVSVSVRMYTRRPDGTIEQDRLLSTSTYISFDDPDDRRVLDFTSKD